MGKCRETGAFTITIYWKAQGSGQGGIFAYLRRSSRIGDIQYDGKWMDDVVIARSGGQKWPKFDGTILWMRDTIFNGRDLSCQAQII